MNFDAIERLLTRGEALLARLEAVLPHPATAPDWGASVAFRYRRRGQVGVIEPVRQVARMALADLKEVDGQKERLVRNTARFVAGQRANNALLTGARLVLPGKDAAPALWPPYLGRRAASAPGVGRVRPR